MTLTFDDGVVMTMWLDQGFGYWWADKKASVNYLKPNSSLEESAKDMLNAKWKLNSGDWPTTVFFSIE